MQLIYFSRNRRAAFEHKNVTVHLLVNTMCFYVYREAKVKGNPPFIHFILFSFDFDRQTLYN